ncbi:MAG: glycosyltransferase family 4 protein [Chthonomonas sp.]|nr:glycosyltransferase family 4 protein [Chthonomonas sp.]
MLIALDARLYGGRSSGDSTYWTGLIDALFTVQHEFDLRLFSNLPPPASTPPIVLERWVTLSAPNNRVWSFVTWPSALRQIQPQLVHTQYSLPFGLPGKKVSTVHDVSFCIEPKWFSPKDRWLLQRGVGSAVRRADAVITVSETSRAEIERYYPAASGKVRVAHNGANTALVGGTRDDHGRPFLLSVATQWPRKNIQLAIDAVDLLPDDLPHRLVLTGKPGATLRLNSRVETTGYVPESRLADLYASASLYLCPSYHEGFGIPLVEAFAAGCPVLSSIGGALPEIGASACEYVDSFDAKTWASRIETLLRDSGKLEALREAGPKRAREFSWEKSAQRHLEIYREVLR